MAAVLTNKSYPLRTSPVLRGKWVLEEILGTPPPPPPPQVKGLPRDEKTTDGLTLRQKLEKHRAEPECAKQLPASQGLNRAMFHGVSPPVERT